ncbi:arginine transport system substrate-binding protein [Legionella londiniensis]|uniref:Arginine transport system periplasmic binding protein n=2 Tax=Legionella londiniensis TaxID=45068 RepID=A0A0W0VR41_9GAMM|nr:arginine transport system periplasmic binding protein [Legionella londiniensis]STX93352.1 arginine transport system substrate-binding protein [Legionella londiniensis]
MIFYFQPQYLAKNMHNDINDSNLPADKRNNPAWQEIKNMKPLIIILLFVSSLAMADPLRIGTLYFYPPFAEQDDEKGDFSGFDIDLMKEICKKINRECVFKGMNFVDLFPALDSGKIDLAIGAISITVKRKYKYLFSYPYLANYVQYIALRSSPIESPDQIRGLTVGMLTGTISRKILNAAFGNQITIKPYLSLNDLINDLKNQNIDTALIDAFTADYWIAANDEIFKKIGHEIRVGSGYGIVALQDKQDLIQSVNQAIVDLEKEGTYLKIYESYFERQ